MSNIRKRTFSYMMNVKGLDDKEQTNQVTVLPTASGTDSPKKQFLFSMFMPKGATGSIVAVIKDQSSSPASQETCNVDSEFKTCGYEQLPLRFSISLKHQVLHMSILDAFTLLFQDKRLRIERFELQHSKISLRSQKNLFQLLPSYSLIEINLSHTRLSPQQFVLLLSCTSVSVLNLNKTLNALDPDNENEAKSYAEVGTALEKILQQSGSIITLGLDNPYPPTTLTYFETGLRSVNNNNSLLWSLHLRSPLKKDILPNCLQELPSTSIKTLSVAGVRSSLSKDFKTPSLKHLENLRLSICLYNQLLTHQCFSLLANIFNMDFSDTALNELTLEYDDSVGLRDAQLDNLQPGLIKFLSKKSQLTSVRFFEDNDSPLPPDEKLVKAIKNNVNLRFFKARVDEKTKDEIISALEVNRERFKKTVKVCVSCKFFSANVKNTFRHSYKPLIGMIEEISTETSLIELIKMDSPVMGLF